MGGPSCITVLSIVLVELREREGEGEREEGREGGREREGERGREREGKREGGRERVELTRSFLSTKQLDVLFLPLISGRGEHCGAMLYSPYHPSALPLSLVHHEHLISIQRVRLLHLCTLHAQWVHEQGARSGWDVKVCSV